MNIKKIKEALIEQKQMNLPGNLYYNTQIGFSYNTNHIEGSTITPDETESIYNTGTILSNSDKVIVLKDATETKNHFTLFKYMIDTISNPLTEDMIKKYHLILKEGTTSDEEKEWFNIGEYKKIKNYIGNTITSTPDQVPLHMKELLDWYNGIKNKSLDEIIEFHVKFETIHPFQDGNGRVGRMIMFRECLINDIMPFYIKDSNKSFYIQGIKEYQIDNKRTRLTDTIKNSQDNYEKLCEYFLEGIDN